MGKKLSAAAGVARAARRTRRLAVAEEGPVGWAPSAGPLRVRNVPRTPRVPALDREILRLAELLLVRLAVLARRTRGDRWPVTGAVR